MANKSGAGLGGPKGRSGKRVLPSWVWLAIFGATLALNVLFYTPRAPARADLPYSAFLTQVQRGNISEVELRGSAITGNFKSEVTWPAQGETSGTSGDKGQPAAPASYKEFQVTRPPMDDPSLLPLLEAQQVTINAVVPSTPWFLEIIGQALPLLLLVGVLVFFSRQLGGGQGMFGFGQSKARRYAAERPDTTFANVAGQDEAKRELAEVVEFLKKADRFIKLGARVPRGVLLSGPPGTGKTLLARAVAGEAAVPFFYVNGSEFVEMIVGVGASRVRDLFTKAKAAAPCLIFIDEIDAIGRTRGGGIMGSHEEREQTLNQLLVEMDGFEQSQAVVVLAATNRADVLDPALTRAGRFDRRVEVEMPDRIGREGILKIHTRPLPLDPSVDLGTLARATAGFSGADLANLANESALAATRRQAEQVGMVDFEVALDRIILGAERRGLMDAAERRLVAYHEAGHALIAMLTPGADPVHKVTIIPRGRALGATEQLPEGDRVNYSRTFLLGRLAVLLGGRAAEELAVGDISTGAESDIREAVRLGRAMLGRWAMSDKLGFISIPQGQPMMAGLGGEREPSEAMMSRIDGELQALLAERHDEARRLLAAHRVTLDAIATALLQEETIDHDRIKAIVGAVDTRPMVEDNEDSAARVAGVN